MSACDICEGRGTIRLPIKSKLRIWDEGFADQQARPGWREFSCPQCAKGGPISTLHVVEMMQLVHDGAMLDELRKNVARLIGERLMADGCIAENVEPLRPDNTRVYRYACGVVSPDHVADMETRLAKARKEFGCQIVGHILKTLRACESIEGAAGAITDTFRDILEKKG